MREIAGFARSAARDVARWLARARPRDGAVRTISKSLGDPVTELDIAGERRLRARIERRWPHHGFVGEETGSVAVDRAHVWIVDPVDGTANFAAGLPPWGVSIACLRDGVPLVGAVHGFPEDVTCWAVRGRGAYLEVGSRRRRIVVPEHARIDADSLVGVQWLRGEERVPFLRRILATGTRVRVHGCTVVQLCDVARGRLHANVQQQGKVWDVAAAGLVVEEAGGRFTDWRGRPIFPCGPEELAEHHASVAGPPRVHEQLVALLPRVPVSRP